MTTPTPAAQEPVQLWSDKRINELITSLLFNHHSPRGLARRVSYTVRDDYEAERAQLLARIAELEAQLSEAQAKAYRQGVMDGQQAIWDTGQY